MTPEEEEQRRISILESLYKQYSVTEDILDLERQLSIEIDEQNSSISGYFKGLVKINDKVRERAKIQKTLYELEKELGELTSINEANLTTSQKARLAALVNITAQTQKTINLLGKEIDILKENHSLSEAIGNSLKKGFDSLVGQHFQYTQIFEYLQRVDKGVRTMQLNMGLSGNKAEFLRKQMQEATNTAQRFGATIDDIVQLQSTVNELTGKANVFTEHQIANMVLIAKGTGMANEEAGQLVGTMLALGSSVEDAKNLVEGTVNETAKLGLNSLSVLKGISANIDKLNNYRFQNGVEGLKNMVEASKKFQFSMEGAFAAGEKFRTLDGLLEAGATLRVLGGEFAKIDEFKFSFLARNKPEEFALEMVKLTKGMASFNKETGLFDIADVDFDKLRVIAEATGRDVNDLAKQTRAFNQIEFAKKQIFVGTDEEKEMLAKLATFSKGSTIGMIQIGDKNVRLDQLTRDQIELYKQTQKTLEQRAADSQNFNDSFTNTIEQFKSTLLPILELINSTLKGFNKIIDMTRDENGKMQKYSILVPLGIMAATSGLLKVLGKLPSILGKIPVLGKIGNFFKGGGADAAATGASNPLLSGKQMLGAGLGSAAKMAAIGIAAVGIGYGFKMAAEGAASLSQSISKLTGEQLTTLQNALTTIGSTMLIGLAAGILAVGVAGQTGAIGLLAVGAAGLMLGAGIGLAALGVSKLVEGFASLDKVDLTKASEGISSIATSSLLLATPASIIGLSSVEETLEDISGYNFNNIIPLQNLHFVDKDIENLKKMEDFLTKINSIDTAKLASLQGLFSNANFKFTLDGDAVLKNTINVDINRDKLTEIIDQRVKIVSRKGNSPN